MEVYLIAVMLAVGIALVVYSFWPGQGQDQQRVLRRMAGQRQEDPSESTESTIDQAAKNFMSAVTPLAIRPVMPRSDEAMSVLRVRLANAGYRGENAASMYLASKTICGLGLAATVVGFTLNKGMEGSTVFGLAGIVGTIGFILPKLWLWMARRKRAEAIRHGLPDSLDLMVISVEAGLALDAAMQRVGDEMAQVHPTLSEEMRVATLETQMGLPRAESLSNLATRTGVPEMKSLVAVITQAEKFGTSIARALRNQADAMRVKRRQLAEERAQKTTVKLMLPLVVFIFPAIFAVLAGPAALKMIDAFTETGLGR